MTRHNIRKKKGLRPGQFRARFWLQRRGYLTYDTEKTPVRHSIDDRRPGWCGRCGHPWEWHHNVWLPKTPEQTVKIRCRGGYAFGLPCHCLLAGRADT